MTRLAPLALAALLLTSCARATKSPDATQQHATRTVVYDDGNVVERYAIDDGTTCYRFFSAGSNGWFCVRDVPR